MFFFISVCRNITKTNFDLLGKHIDHVNSNIFFLQFNQP